MSSLADAPDKKRATSEKDMERLRNLKQRHNGLKTEASSWNRRWEDISRHMRPNGYRGQPTDSNRQKVDSHDAIINFTPLEAARTLSAGMMTGITSPARPWFRLSIPANPELSESMEVKTWLDVVVREMRTVMARSNFYRALSIVYADLGPFGLACLYVEEDELDDIRCHVFPVGSYVLASSARGVVDTMMREVRMTVAQMVDTFGVEKCPQAVRTAYETDKKFDTMRTVVHAVFEKAHYNEGEIGEKGKPIASYWWDQHGDEADGFLREAGFEEMPIMAPRWSINGTDTYGTGPGFDALGDCRGLQLLEMKSAELVEKLASPPMIVPASLKNARGLFVPRASIPVDQMGSRASVHPAIEINPHAVDVTELKIRQHEDRIKRAFYAHLWLLVSDQSNNDRKTATEIQALTEEKLQQLGAVLEGLHDELLDPVIDRIFAILWRRGRIPDPPKELQGLDWKVEYLSIMAQAQKAVATTGLNRLASFVGNLAGIPGAQSAIDKLDIDNLIDETADALGTPPGVIRPDDAVKGIREERAKAQQAQAQGEQAMAATAAAKNLATSPTGEGNALDQVLRGVGAR